MQNSGIISHVMKIMEFHVSVVLREATKIQYIIHLFHLCILYVDFLGGVAYQETSSGSGPYFLGEVNCKGSESHLFNCSIGVEECDSQYSLGSAGVLCYRQQSRSILILVSF